MRYMFILLAVALLAACSAQDTTSAPQGASPVDQANEMPTESAEEPAAPAQGAGVETIPITLRNWEIEPSTLELSSGQAYELVISSESGRHGLMIPQLGVATDPISAGETVTVQVTPTEPGTYRGQCNVYCGEGHNDMRMTVVVT